MPSRTVDLPDHLDHFLEESVASGRFPNASDAVGEGLRLLAEREQEEQTKLEWLRAAAKEGFDALDQGEYVVLNSDEDIDAFMQRTFDEASASVAVKP